MQRDDIPGPGGVPATAGGAGATDTPDSKDSKHGERTPWSQLASVAGTVHSDGVSRGERAELRRMRRGDMPPEVYWRLTESLTWPRGGKGEGFEDFWMTILPLMTRNEHLPKAHPGHVLADAGVKTPRVERWLRRDRESAWAEAVRLLSITKGAPLDWARLGYLLWTWDDPKVKRTFAREYFRAARKRAAHRNDDHGDS